MAIEFPYNLVGKTTARASEVMANLKALRTVIEGGLTLANFAAGGFPSGQSFINTTPVAIGAANIDLLPSGVGGESFTLAVKSKVLFLVDVDVQLFVLTVGEANKAWVRSTLFIDNVEQACYAELGGDSFDTEFILPLLQASVGDHRWIELAAGVHQVRLLSIAHNGSGKAWNAKVSMLVVPV
jgi:hypothetical protein